MGTTIAVVEISSPCIDREIVPVLRVSDRYEQIVIRDDEVSGTFYANVPQKSVDFRSGDDQTPKKVPDTSVLLFGARAW